MKFFRLLFDHLAWIEHQFLSGIGDSMKTRSLWGMMRGVGGVRKSIHQSWLAKALGLGLLCWGLGGSGRDSLGRGQHTSNRVSGLSTRKMHQSTTPSLSQTIWPRLASRQFLSLPIVETLLPVTWFFPKLRGCRYETIEEMKEAVAKIIDTALTRGLPWGLPEVVVTVEQVHCSWRRLLRRRLEFHMCTINKSAHTKKVWKHI